MSPTTQTYRDLAARLIDFLETGTAAEGLFAADAFCDFTIPQWRLQAQGAADIVPIAAAWPPSTGPGAALPLRRQRTTGFVLEVEEEWDQDGESWYCRELFRADVADGAIRDISVYCTGDWDRATVAKHRETVRLVRP